MRTRHWTFGLGLIGVISAQGVAVAATFYVDAATGDDSRTAAQAQAAATPWKTLTRATSEDTIASGDTVSVAAGTYNAALGESFPLPLLSGVAIEGAGTGTVVEGTGSYVFRASEVNLASGTRVSDLTVTSVDNGVGVRIANAVGKSAPLITNTTFTSQLSAGVSISQSVSGSFSGSISNNSFASYNSGVSLYWSGPGVCSALIEGNTFTDASRGVGAYQFNAPDGSEFSPLVMNNTFSGGVSTAISVSASSIHGDATMAPLVDGNTITDPSGTGVYAGFYVAYDGAHVNFSPTISNNSVSGSGSHSIYAYFSSVSSSATLESHLTIAGNTVTSSTRRGIEIEVSELSDSGTVDFNFLIANNTVTDAGSRGISFSASSMTNLNGAVNLTIAGNTVTGSGSSGISVSMETLSAATLDLNVLIAGNTVSGSEDDGIYVFAESQSSLTSSRYEISNNVLTDNLGYGLNLSLFDANGVNVLVARNVMHGNAGAVQLYDGGEFVDLGGGDLSSPGLNDFSDNGDDFLLNSYALEDVFARLNYWGLTDTAEIDAVIHDDDESDLKVTWGAVDFGSPAATAPTRAATVTVTSAIANDVAPTGLSPGDELRYTATGTATADLGCVEAAFVGEVPSGTAYKAGSATADGGISVALTGDAHVGVGVIAPGSPVHMSWTVVVGEGTGCDEIEATAKLVCAPLSDITSAPKVDVRVGVAEIADDGIDQDCDGEDLISDGTNDTDDTTGTTDDDTTDDDDTKAKCGCDTSSPAGGAWMLGLAALALTRRRRS